jgi:hypothetical protein
VLAILSKPLRFHFGLPRDVAQMLALAVWRLRRQPAWESAESVAGWSVLMSEWEEIATEFDDDVAESDESGAE